MAETDEELPKGYDIQHWSNPDQWLVYRDPGTCKCCGHKDGYLRRIGPHEGFTTFQGAKAWLMAHIEGTKNGKD